MKNGQGTNMALIEIEPKNLKRELALIRVVVEGARQDEALNVVGAWSGRLLELRPTYFTAEFAGEPDRVSRFIKALDSFGQISCQRSGVLALDL